jgi:glycerophosphoryl diester phosphodiesterase
MNIIAHRGASSLAPENTLAAFNKAAVLGSQWFELDVQLTLDKVPVVFHDQTVERCTNGTGVLSQMNLQTLKLLDAGLWFGEAFRDEKIPTLEETLDLAKTLKLNINIELKLYPEDDPILLCKYVNEVIIRSNIPSSSLLFSSFNFDALEYMHQHQPAIRRGLLWDEIPDDALDYLNKIDAYSVHCDAQLLTEEKAKWVKLQAYQLYCYTVNLPEQAQQLWSWGVDMVFSDTPQHYLTTEFNNRV